jgi:addiction module HigA family antidote
MVRIPTKGLPAHPGEMLLEEFLTPLGMAQTEPAERTGVSYSHISERIHGKWGVTPGIALRLERLFGMEAQSCWLNLNLASDLYHMLHLPAAKKIRKTKRPPGRDDC